jgi:hypothetical protein
MVPSALLLATTNQVCLDVASVPFLWVFPLSLYLLSFILCFDSDRWYSRRFLMPAAAVALLCVYPVLRAEADLAILIQIGVYFTTLFLCAIVCHGELARRRPPLEHLTSFYLRVAAGGAAGGIFVGIFSPLLFNDYFELHLALFGSAALMLMTLWSDRQNPLSRGRLWPVWLALVAIAGTYTFGLIEDARDQKTDVVEAGRRLCQQRGRPGVDVQDA